MTRFTYEDIERRAPVGAVMADLFASDEMDTADFRRTAAVMKQSGFSLFELETIFSEAKAESPSLYPCIDNLLLAEVGGPE